MARDDADRRDTRHAFDDLVNMTAGELRDWLGTPESQAAGQHRDGAESVGHASGRHIVSILDKREESLSPGDYDHMSKVVGYIRRHLRQRPSGDVRDSRWRHSLMNWGHDPLKR